MVGWWLAEADLASQTESYIDARKFTQFNIGQCIERYVGRINMILRHTPFHIMIQSYEDKQKGLQLQSEWVIDHSNNSCTANDIYSLWRIETVHKTHPNILVDVEVTLTSFVEQAYDILNMCESPSLNEYLVHPQPHIRDFAKLLYEINHGNNANAKGS